MSSYPQWMIDAWVRAMKEDSDRRWEALKIKRQAERQAGER